MPMRWSYLGELGPNGSLDWSGACSGNIPASGYILPDNNDPAIFNTIREHARAWRFEGTQVDWSAYAIRVNGPELLSVLRECYAEMENAYQDSLIGQYFHYAKHLGSNQYVAFMAAEL